MFFVSYSSIGSILVHLGIICSGLGGTWLLYHAFNIKRRNKSIYSLIHHFGGICVILLTLLNLFMMYKGKDLLKIEMIYIGVSMIMSCTFAISVMNQLPKKNTRTQRVFSFAVVMGTNIGLSFLFQFYSFKFYQKLFFKDYISIFICLLLILHGLIVTLLDIIDCILVLISNIFNTRNPMKCVEAKTYSLDIYFKNNPIYIYFIRTPYKIFEKRSNKHSRSDGEEPLTTIKTPVIWIGLIAQLIASIAYGYFNLWFLFAQSIDDMNICKDGYLIGFQLRQQFLLAVVPNCMAMFAATLVFKGKIKVRIQLIAFMAIWLLFGFVFMFSHKIVFMNHNKYNDLSLFFAFILQC